MTPKNWIELMDGPKLSYKRHIEKIQHVENVGTWPVKMVSKIVICVSIDSWCLGILTDWLFLNKGD